MATVGHPDDPSGPGARMGRRGGCGDGSRQQPSRWPSGDDNTGERLLPGAVTVVGFPTRLRRGMLAREAPRSMRVLLIEDSPRLQGTVSAALRRSGYAVAVDRRELDQALAAVGLARVICSGLFLVITAVAVPRLLGHELAPLNRLADQAQQITAVSLSVRFPTSGLRGELAPITNRLNDLLDRLQQAFERERQFSADLAHEFRTPLAELRSLAELAWKWPEAREAGTARQVLDIARQMEAIVTRILAMALSEAGQASLSVERVELRELIATVCQSLQARPSARQLSFDVSLAARVEIVSDPACLRLVLANLVENAVEYAPTGDVVLIQAAAQNGRFDLRVVNRAEQLTSADLPHSFKRFWREDAARTAAEHAGLGLSLARSLATSLGCTLTATLQGEACLSLTLSGPVNPPPPPSGLSAMSVPKTLPSPESTRP